MGSVLSVQQHLHILALRRLIEVLKDKNLKCIITFIDFKKAFDSVHRGKMVKILKAYGIPDTIVQAINVMYSNTQAVVLSADGETDAFEILAEVLQLDTLAPYLFILVLDYVMRVAIGNDKGLLGFTVTPRKSRRHPAKVITDLDFADDALAHGFMNLKKIHKALAWKAYNKMRTLKVSPACLLEDQLLSCRRRKYFTAWAEGWTITNLRQDLMAAISDC